MKKHLIKPGLWPIKEYTVTREEAAAALGISLLKLSIMEAKTRGQLWVQIGKRTCRIEADRESKAAMNADAKPAGTAGASSGS